MKPRTPLSEAIIKALDNGPMVIGELIETVRDIVPPADAHREAIRVRNAMHYHRGTGKTSADNITDASVRAGQRRITRQRIYDFARSGTLVILKDHRNNQTWVSKANQE